MGTNWTEFNQACTVIRGFNTVLQDKLALATIVEWYGESSGNKVLLQVYKLTACLSHSLLESHLHKHTLAYCILHM